MNQHWFLKYSALLGRDGVEPAPSSSLNLSSSSNSISISSHYSALGLSRRLRAKKKLANSLASPNRRMKKIQGGTIASCALTLRLILTALGLSLCDH